MSALPSGHGIHALPPAVFNSDTSVSFHSDLAASLVQNGFDLECLIDALSLRLCLKAVKRALLEVQKSLKSHVLKKIPPV